MANGTMAHDDQGGSTGQAYGTPGYRNYVLFALTFVFTLNFIDRILIGVVAQPIIEEFKLQDWQFGLLSGFGFALMYTVAGIPIARLAERTNRVKIIAFSVVLWSAMTAMCGLAGSFLSLLIFRIGVGIGEAGCTPPANSLIADYFPPRSRARALATYALGITLGSVLANIFGGPLAQSFSWRTAFLVLGIPGVLVGIVVWFTIKEPPRGYSDPVGTPKVQAMGIMPTLKILGSKPTYWLNMIAATLVAFAGYGFSNFQAAFFQRSFGMSVGDVATQISVPLGLAAAAGTFGAGFLTEKFSGRFPSFVAWFSGLCLLVSVPFYWIGLSSASASSAAILIGIGAFLHYGYLGAQYTICQGVADAKSRATAIAIMLFIVNLIGYGLGPLFIGFLSDVLAAAPLEAANLSVAACKGTEAALIASIGAEKMALCRQATAIGLGSAMQYAGLVFGLGGIFYLLTSRFMHKDMVARMD